MASGKPVVGGSDVHMMFHKLSQEALKITAEINGKYHTPEQLHDLLEQLWGREVPKTVGMFPPFHTDCGKNTVVGERVFIPFQLIHAEFPLKSRCDFNGNYDVK